MNVMIVLVRVILGYERRMRTCTYIFIGLECIRDVHDYVTHCQKCQVNKAERLKAGGLLQP